MPEVFISRQPLINRQNRILATRLNLHLLQGATAQEAVDALRGLAEYWPSDEKQVFLNCSGFDCPMAFLEWGIPSNTTLEVHGATFDGPDAATLIPALQTAQYSLCLMVDEYLREAIASGTAFRFIGLDVQRLAQSQLKILAAKTQSYGICVAFGVNDSQSFQNCLDAGVNAAASWFFKTPSGAPAKALNPSQAKIIQILNLVRQDADVREIEAELKRDVTLSYKLLRYINSAGFGLSCEIQSFMHAVTILGYDKLNKWLSLLLATASKDPMAQAMMHTSLVRARLMELLGHDLIDKSEHDYLFITGAFSMLEALLGVGMDKVLETMSLPERICDALLGNGGVYGPFLDLAIACESDDAQLIADQAAMLGFSSEQLNIAHLKALNFADTIKI